MTLVRQDDESLYIIVGGVTARPGAVNGYAHAMRMDDGGLVKGDKIKAKHVGGSELVCITLPEGEKTYWYSQGPTRDRGMAQLTNTEQPPVDINKILGGAVITNVEKVNP